MTNIPLHTISVLVRNQPGVLVRVALVFARRGYNIESLVVCPDLRQGTPDFSRMTITCSGDPETLEQIIKQVAKLVDVVRAIDHTGQSAVETEIALVKIKANIDERTVILQTAEHYKAKVVDCSPSSLILRVTGASEKLDSFIDLGAAFRRGRAGPLRQDSDDPRSRSDLAHALHRDLPRTCDGGQDDGAGIEVAQAGQRDGLPGHGRVEEKIDPVLLFGRDSVASQNPA